MSTTVQNIIDAAQQDAMNRIGASHPALIDYCNRISLEILRTSRWDFLLSDIQRFVTQLGVTDYWIGATAGNPEGSYDTGLNLLDVKIIKHGSVFDRSNFKPLQPVTEQPLAAKLMYADVTSRLNRPAVYRHSISTPNILNIYPAADNQNTYRPQPVPAICTTTAGGALAARVYYVTTTFVDSQGNESTAPQSTKIYVPANQLLFVHPPQEPQLTNTIGIKYDRYNVYASITKGSECLQNGGTPINVSAHWTEGVGGLTTGTVSAPTNNSVEPIDGYIIEFRYYKARTLLTTTAQTLQIPDDYKDVVVAGVNWLALKYLGQEEPAVIWYRMFKDGITQMVRDRNFANRFSDYISPDGSTVGGRLPAVESIDLSVLIP